MLDDGKGDVWWCRGETLMEMRGAPGTWWSGSGIGWWLGPVVGRREGDRVEGVE